MTHTCIGDATGLPRSTPTEAVPQPYRYAGAYADPTGLYKVGHRYCDPALGRFTQPDPSGQETNPYLYADGDPVNRTDPTGLFSFSDILDTGSEIFGVVSGCVSGIGAAASTGTIQYAAAVGGMVGAGVGQRGRRRCRRGRQLCVGRRRGLLRSRHHLRMTFDQTPTRSSTGE
ncbi:RHS repeat-associated core domain-containing protein [Streptomyces sp. NPDC058783]|uniref:RHS repeat-associated core domain-containing protein n=1 Tax=Streptomyces sp. NPDC058783 TaxID=3346633 RepID=UPI00369DBF60